MFLDSACISTIINQKKPTTAFGDYGFWLGNSKPKKNLSPITVIQCAIGSLGFELIPEGIGCCLEFAGTLT